MNRKIFIAVIAALCLLTAALAAITLTNPKLVEEKITGLYTSTETVKARTPLFVYAELTFENLSFDQATKIYFSFKDQNPLYFGSEQANFSELSSVDAYLNSFKGNLKITKSKLEMQGQTKTLEINKMVLTSVKNQTLDVRGIWNFTKAKIDLELDKFTLVSSGTIRIGEKAQLNVQNDTITLNNFVGTFTFSNNSLIINGTTESMTAAGQDYGISIN
ncbi:MAG: hypothetical protein ACPLYW_00840 [Candidatus Nanoarchaeia archaeon]